LDYSVNIAIFIIVLTLKCKQTYLELESFFPVSVMLVLIVLIAVVALLSVGLVVVFTVIAKKVRHRRRRKLFSCPQASMT